jgi:zinc transporter 1/2/3
MLPQWLGNWHRGEKFLIYGHALSGGVFLGAGLLHMLFEAIEQFHEVAPDSEFPWIMLITIGGFLLVLFIEKVLFRNAAVGTLTGEKSILPYLLLLILSLHSIIAGAAMGLESSLQATVIIFIAIIAHKVFAAFALGISLKESNIEQSAFNRNIAIFASMTPIGILLGAGLSAILEDSVAIEAIFGAIAAGTFIYVAILEIIEELFGNPEHRWGEFVFLSLGIAFMAVLAVWG